MEAAAFFKNKIALAKKRNSFQPISQLKESDPALRYAASSVKTSKFGIDIKKALRLEGTASPRPEILKPQALMIGKQAMLFAQNPSNTFTNRSPRTTDISKIFLPAEVTFRHGEVLETEAQSTPN